MMKDFQKLSVLTKLDKVGWDLMRNFDAHSFPEHFNPKVFRPALPK